MPSLLPDLLRPTFWDRDLFNFDLDLMPARLGITIPTANISENASEYKLELAAPGLQRKDFNLEIDNHTLIISVEQEEEKEKEEDGYSKKEYSFNSFSRNFFLPENVKEDGIQAKYENGILKVTIPKVKETPLKPVQKIKVT
ncbi:Hsp20/alpha crystallin family protein [Cyclobacterium jeungdonense]|uniref:Hsp20/alpha crystallin family protein n=1 Tax=Cyclobacterium jeungdonense TaxID=708087 RepID=A0ABT8CCN0_9BACT|nr:Hsp20/alpha crystallin family protein [Cyclobacterium jeungdonense]MDN3690152.1 Hsp20/alpha crystallin family protein [Cyclobacterium jeungdonense]